MSSNPTTALLRKYNTEIIHKHAPGFSIQWKSQALLMKIIKPFMFWNPHFSEYITTIGNTVYVPDYWLTNSDLFNLTIIAHEAVHARDSKKNPFFAILYLFPQVFWPLLAIALAFISPWFLFVALLGVLPMPAPFRFYYELRGYRMDLLITEKVLGNSKTSTAYQEEQTYFIEQMTGQWYFWAMPLKGYVAKKINETGWESEDIYKDTIEFCNVNIPRYTSSGGI